MSYLAFALKYRPKNFDEVVGQAHVVTALRNAIVKERVHHAYLFSGPRGIGKTSLARILAKSLNCEKGPTVTPCEKCISCIEISKGSSLDIIEIDGASNRGIDEIRTLRENVKLSAAHSRYKIYIIDEVHMLTQEAFNALLKTLEEPPAHVKFIFATTHPHKVLPTILSRCQKFGFNLIPLEDIVAKLKKITDAEKIKIKENLLYTIGRAAGGSIRDAESLLDQLVPVILEKGSIEDVFSFLGIVDEDSLNRMLKTLIEKDLSGCLDFIEKTARDGKDLGIFLNAFIEHLRNLLLARVSVKSFKELSDISPQSKDFIISLAKQVSTKDILKIIDLLIETKELSHRLNTVRIPFELALIKFSHQDKDDVEIKAKSNPAPKPKPVQKDPVEPDIKKAEDIVLDIDDLDIEEPVQKKEEKEEDPDIEDTSRDDALLEPVKAKWEAIISHIQKTRAALASHLSFGQPLFTQGKVVAIGFPKEDYFHKEVVEGSKNLKFIEEMISRFIDKPVGVKFVLADIARKFVQDNREDEESEQMQIKDIKVDDPENEGFINELLDTFGGKFHNDD